MKFTKMHGAGNDFVIINNMVEGIPTESLPGVARCLCARRLSIGADGLMVVDQPTEGGDFKMRFYNADGSIGEMCGNGARCIARYGYENGLSGAVQKIETTAGLVTGWRVSERQYRVRLNDPTVIRLDYPLEADHRAFDCAYIELGNPGLPHAIVFFDALEETDDDTLRDLGRMLRWHTAFPKGANVTFCKILDENDFLIRTFERGVEDFTLACGTGSGATAAAAALRGLTDGRDVHLHMPGGELIVSLSAADGWVKDIFLTGPTNIVAEGIVLDEDMPVLQKNC